MKAFILLIGFMYCYKKGGNLDQSISSETSTNDPDMNSNIGPLNEPNGSVNTKSDPQQDCEDDMDGNDSLLQDNENDDSQQVGRIKSDPQEDCENDSQQVDQNNGPQQENQQDIMNNKQPKISSYPENDPLTRPKAQKTY